MDEATGSLSGTPQRVNLNTAQKTTLTSSMNVPNAAALKRNNSRTQSTTNDPIFSKSDVVPVIVPRTSARLESAAESRKEVGVIGKTMPFSLLSKTTEFQKFPKRRDESSRATASVLSESTGPSVTELSRTAHKNFSSARNLSTGSLQERNMIDDKRNMIDDKRNMIDDKRNMIDDRFTGKHAMNSTTDPPFYQHQHGTYDNRVNEASRDDGSIETRKGGRAHSIVSNWEKRERPSSDEGRTTSNSTATTSLVNMLQSHERARTPSAVKETMSVSGEDDIADIMEQHDQFVGLMMSRYSKLQVVRRYWERNDIKSAIGTMEKMADMAVTADVISILAEKPDIVTLDICACLLPLLTNLLHSDMDRHLGISLEMLLKLVKVFGSLIYSTVSASTSVGVDIEAEQRLERCNLCFIELEKVKRCLPVLTRRGGSVTKLSQEMNLSLQEFL